MNNNKPKKQRNWMWIIVAGEWLVLTIAALIAMLTLAGCTTTKYIPVESTREVHHYTHRADTLLMWDSVVIDRAGDTIRELRWRDRWRVSVEHDTLLLTDTIRDPYPVEVPAKLTAWERVKVGVGGYALALLALAAALLLYRLKRRA